VINPTINSSSITLQKESLNVHLVVVPSVAASVFLILNHLYKKEITEVIDFFGLVLSKQEFEKQFSFDPNEILKLVKNSTNQDISEMDKIIDENQLKFDVDEILDKISNYGIDVLTPEERKFLDNFGDGKID
jgi:hypothetical protein